MKSFPTQGPITTSIELMAGDIKVNASDREDCVVDLRPRDESKPADVQAAKTALVEFASGVLTIKTLKPWRRFTGPNKSDGALIVEVSLPTGSALDATTGMGLIHCEGELADVSAKTGLGDIRLDHAAVFTAKTGLGDVDVDRVSGDAKVSTGSGAVRVGAIEGSATIKNANGLISIGECGRFAQVRTACGDVFIERALSSVNVASAAGDVRVQEVSAGSVSIRTGAGSIEIGVREGAAAWLELTARYGSVRNGLTTANGPEAADSTVEVRARSGGGDISVHRADAADREGVVA